MGTPERKQEITKQEITKQDYPYQVVGKYFWAKNNGDAMNIWKNIIKDNQDWLAKMAWVTKYDGAVNNGVQNITIANRLRKNDVERFYDYPTNAKKINNFDEVQKIIKNKNLSNEKTMEFYISNLNDSQIQTLNGLSTLQKALFIAEECKNVDTNQTQIQGKIEYGGYLENKNLAVMKELENRVGNMNNFLEKHKMSEFMLDQKTKIFTDREFEKQYQSRKNSDEYKKGIEKNKDKGDIDFVLRWAYMQQKMYASEKYAALAPDAKQELANITWEYYTITQKLEIDLESFDLGVVYARARDYLRIQYGNYEKEPAHTLMNTINTDPQVTNFFAEEENKISSLVPKEVKSEKTENKIYYTKLFTQYPDINIIPGGMKLAKEYLAYFNDDMTIKKDITPSEKEEAGKSLIYIKERTASREWLLLDKTNKIVQDYAMNQCIESLQQYMNINIDEKQNLLDQLKVMKGTAVTSSTDGELMLKINGERAGKKMTLSYDLVSGQVYYHSFLYKSSINETDPLVMGNQSNNNKLPLTTIASMKTILTWAQNTNYKELFLQSDDMKSYTENIKENMDKKVIFWKNSSSDMGKDILKKQVIQDDIVQNITFCTGKTWWANKTISKESPNIHGLYNYIYKSLEYCSMQSVDQLMLFDKNIHTLLTYRNKKISIDEVIKYKEDKKNPNWNQNQEMFALQSLIHSSNIPEITSALTDDQWPEEKLKLFFDCFDKEIWGIHIIDQDMMNDYFTAATWTNKENNAIGKWKRNDKFTTLTNNLETKISGDQASVDLDTQLNMV